MAKTEENGNGKWGGGPRRPADVKSRESQQQQAAGDRTSGTRKVIDIDKLPKRIGAGPEGFA